MPKNIVIAFFALATILSIACAFYYKLESDKYQKMTIDILEKAIQAQENAAKARRDANVSQAMAMSRLLELEKIRSASEAARVK